MRLFLFFLGLICMGNSAVAQKNTDILEQSFPIKKMITTVIDSSGANLGMPISTDFEGGSNVVVIQTRNTQSVSVVEGDFTFDWRSQKTRDGQKDDVFFQFEFLQNSNIFTIIEEREGVRIQMYDMHDSLIFQGNFFRMSDDDIRIGMTILDEGYFMDVLGPWFDKKYQASERFVHTQAIDSMRLEMKPPNNPNYSSILYKEGVDTFWVHPQKVNIHESGPLQLTWTEIDTINARLHVQQNDFDLSLTITLDKENNFVAFGTMRLMNRNGGYSDPNILRWTQDKTLIKVYDQGGLALGLTFEPDSFSLSVGGPSDNLKLNDLFIKPDTRIGDMILQWRSNKKR